MTGCSRCPDLTAHEAGSTRYARIDLLACARIEPATWDYESPPPEPNALWWRWMERSNTEPVALSSTVSTSFPPGLSASAYNPQRRLRPNRAPCSVHANL